MVHYVFTPWRDRHELLAVRRQFYPDGTAATGLAGDDNAGADAAAAAVARVAIWMQRGHCPHMVESTALLAAALLQERSASTMPSSVSSSTMTSSPAASAATAASAYAARAAYAAAFARFVTGLLDGHQDRARKLSMHGLARTVGLPPAFVELRHQATHEQLPSLRRLRTGAHQALAWIWQYYWVHLEGGEGDKDTDDTATTDDDACRAAVARCVDGPDEEADTEATDDTARVARLVRKWGDARVLAALAALAALSPSAAAGGGAASSCSRALRCMRLSRLVLQGVVSKETKTTAATQRRTTRAETKKTENGTENDSTNTVVPWTAANLDLDAVRATMAQQRLALYQTGTRSQAVEKDEEEDRDGDEGDAGVDADVDMTEAEADPDSVVEPETDWPAPRPRWTRYEGDWTPRPIGTLVRAEG